jgi:hypothetical protein
MPRLSEQRAFSLTMAALATGGARDQSTMHVNMEPSESTEQDVMNMIKRFTAAIFAIAMIPLAISS